MPELNLIVLYVKDVESSARFYKALGIDFSEEQHGNGPKHLAGRVGAAAVLELYPSNTTMITSGLRLGFTITSYQGILEAIADAGGAVKSGPKPGPWGYRAVVADPDGNKIELVKANDG